MPQKLTNFNNSSSNNNNNNNKYHLLNNSNNNNKYHLLDNSRQHPNLQKKAWISMKSRKTQKMNRKTQSLNHREINLIIIQNQWLGSNPKLTFPQSHIDTDTRIKTQFTISSLDQMRSTFLTLSCKDSSRRLLLLKLFFLQPFLQFSFKQALSMWWEAFPLTVKSLSNVMKSILTWTWLRSNPWRLPDLALR